MDSRKFRILRTISIVCIFLFVTNLITNAATIQPTSDAVVSDTLVDHNLNSGTPNTNTVPVPLASNSLSYAVNTRLEENPYNNYEDKLNLHSSSSILIDMDVNKILYEKNAYQKMYPASTTKTLTAILTVEKCDLNSEVAVSYWAVNSVGSNYSKAKLVPGELITVNDLLRTMMIESANDSAYVLGQYIANNCSNTYPTDSSDTAKTYFTESIADFSSMMNEKAKSLGCINSDFKNPNGMHVDTHYSCAYDLALIGQYAYSINLIREIVKEKNGTLQNTDKYTGSTRTYTTTNLLFSSGKATYYEYATGLKTGYTSAGKSCMIATAEKDNRHLLCVVLYAEGTQRESDIKTLFEYGFNNYNYTTLVSQNEVVQTISTTNATAETRELNVLAQDEIKILINIEEDKTVNINPEIKITRKLAPIKAGDVVGKITYTVHGKKYETNLIAEHDVEVKNYFIYIGIIFGVFLIALIIVIIKEKR